MATTDTEHHDDSGADAVATEAVDTAVDEHGAGEHGDVTHIELGPGEHDHPKDSLYVIIALVLACLTALEVSTYYLDFGALFLPTLLVLMSVKFWLVVQFFMHLKFDAPIFGRLFWTGVIGAAIIYVVTLATFQVFFSS